MTVSPPWEMTPDSSSYFAVAEGGWKFGALAKSSTAEFAIPNQSGETVQIIGRAANVNDLECAAELSTVTRWQIGGSGAGGSDADVPPAPYFALAPGRRGGTVELSAVSFTELTNTHTISAGDTDAVLQGRTSGRGGGVAAGVSEVDMLVDLVAADRGWSAEFVQIEGGSDTRG